jgi:hypothetical protein
MIRVDVPCSNCAGIVRVEDVGAGDRFVCQCGQSVTIDASNVENGALQSCCVCGTGDLYLQKDFPQRLGLALVISAMVLATIAWAYRDWFATMGILVGFFAADLVLYLVRGNVTVCYRCLAQYRGASPNPGIRPFDLAIGERYRQERLRKRAIHGAMRQPSA